jgi:PTH1 family peptidyl-tRNA hydrolase
MIADTLSFAGELVWKEKFKGMVATRAGTTFLKPLTYMNRSGESVVACTSFFRVGAEELLVVHDDMELAFERVEIRQGGGLGGHNGLKDVVRALGNREFVRLRFGISRPARGTPTDHVLGRFSPDEETFLPVLLLQAARLIEKGTSK